MSTAATAEVGIARVPPFGDRQRFATIRREPAPHLRPNGVLRGARNQFSLDLIGTPGPGPSILPIDADDVDVFIAGPGVGDPQVERVARRGTGTPDERRLRESFAKNRGEALPSELERLDLLPGDGPR